MNKNNHFKSFLKNIFRKVFLMREYRPIKTIDNKIQKLVNTTEELVDSIDYYLRYDKFN